MRLRIERRRPPPARPVLLHVTTPRTNAAAIASAENLLGALAGSEPFALEVAADHTARWFLARAGCRAMADRLADHLAVAYPQAEIEPVDIDKYPGADPAAVQPGEQACSAALVLRASEYLPLRTFSDLDVGARPAAQNDPLLGLLGALGGLPPGWRSLSQLALAQVPPSWARRHARRALENPVAAERTTGRSGLQDLMPVFLALGFLGLVAFGPRVLHWYRTHDYLRLGGVALGLALGLTAVVWLANHAFQRGPDDPRLVREKLGPLLFRAQLRLTLFAPAAVPAREVEARLCALAGAYRQFDLATGNGLVARRLRPRGDELRAPRPLGRATAVLNVRELAGLWHLPQAEAEAPFVARTAARQRLPLPHTVARGCPIGVARHQGREVPVAVPEDLLRRHMLLVAKTRRGKSTLIQRLARYLMDERFYPPRALVLVDPHRDLAEAVLGCAPRHRWADVVHLDVGDTEHPFGLNLLDVALGWTRDKAVDNAVQIFKREFDKFWGPRMEDAFVHALATLYEANTQRKRVAQFTLLDVAHVLADGAFRRHVLEHHAIDPVLAAWWSGYFNRLDPKLQLEIINPVQTKIHRFSGNAAARRIVGQPASTIDPAEWLATGQVVVVSTAKNAVGENAAALIGATLLNLVGLVVGEQAGLPPRDRRGVSILVDEFHAMPGADYEAILSELAKYGASLVLATQSLARLDALDREHQRALKATVFANLDGLFAFHVSAEDARYLVHELGEGVDEEDLVSLGEHRCYARLSVGGERLPVFSVELDPPAPVDPALCRHLAARSARRYGRPWAAVDELLAAALALIAACHGSRATDETARREDTREAAGAPTGADDQGGRSKDDEPDQGSAGTPARPTDRPPGGVPAAAVPEPPRPPGTPRNWHRPRRTRAADQAAAEQTTYLNDDGAARRPDDAGAAA